MAIVTDDKPSTFMDKVHASLFETKLENRSISKEAQHVLAQHRAKLRQAERFVLDDNAVSLVCHLCHEWDRLEGWSFLARLPFPIMWIEYNLHTKVCTFDKMDSLRHPLNTNEVSPVMGLLFYKDGNSETRWICHNFIDMNGSIIPGLVTYLFDPEGDESMPLKRSSTWGSSTLSSIPNFPKIPAQITKTYGTHYPSIVDAEYVLAGDFNGNENGIRVGSWFTSKGAAIIEPFWQQHLSGLSKDKLHDIIATEILEEAGAIRWVMTLLATINSLPRDVRPIQPRPGRITVGMHKLQHMSHFSLTINVPQDDKFIWSRHRLDRAASNVRMKWHGVRGHWRIVERGGKTPGYVCRHIPTMVDSGLGMCEKCNLLIRWIEVPHGRGDPSLGIVEHIYTIKGPKTV